MDKESNKSIKFILASIVVILMVMLLVRWYSPYEVVDIKIINMSVNISEGGFGFDVRNDSLSFGKLTIGDTSKRNIILYQDKYECLKVKIRKQGDIAKWIKVSDRVFNLDRGIKKNVSFVLKVPNDAKKGFYNTTLTIIMYK